MPTTPTPAQLEEFEGLAALYRSGGLTLLEFVRGRRALLGSSYTQSASAMRRHTENGTRYGQGVRRFLTGQRRYSDEALTADLASPLPGLRRQARILLTLPTLEERQAAVRDAHRFCNATPDAGRWSDALAAAAR